MLPKYCSISVLCILLLITPLFALRCYDCEDCVNNKVETEECERDQNACIKVTIGDVISKTCINENFCTAQKFEEGIQKAWHKIKNIFVDDEEAQPGARAFSCCSTDYCNSGNNLRTAFGTFGASFFLVGITYFLN